MNNYVELIEALNRITEAVSTHSVLRDFFSTFLATVGSIAAVLAVEAIKERFFAPRREFKQLRKKVNILLDSHSRFFTNQIDCKERDNPMVARYSSAAESLREMAMELRTFTIDAREKQYYGVTITRIQEASKLLIGLSNSFFTPYGCPDNNTNQENREASAAIKELLGIDPKKGLCYT
mgnify:FL=1